MSDKITKGKIFSIHDNIMKSWESLLIEVKYFIFMHKEYLHTKN